MAPILSRQTALLSTYGRVRRTYGACMRRGHTTENTTAMYIPRRYTSRHQVLDVGVNEQFKDRRQYNNFCLTTGEQKESRLHVATWIFTAWSLVTNASIKRAGNSIGYHPSG